MYGAAATMKITVVLCTYNRCRSLAVALESAANLQMPPDVSWEILVVDNNSSDGTAGVVEEFRSRYPARLSYIFEPRPGKSHALNTAIRVAQGDVLAFMDDDVTVDPSWLASLTASLQSGEWAGAGGRILPNRGFSAPPWLAAGDRQAMAPLALFDLGAEAGRLHEPPFGTNMAFRREVFVRYGGFRTDLGPQPGSQIRSEDTEFGQRLLAGGERLRYEPSAVVYHPVAEARLQKRYFLDWWFDKGRAEVIEAGAARDFAFSVAGVPFYLLRRLMVWSVRRLIASRPSERFHCETRVSYLKGEVSQFRREAASNKSIRD